MDKVGWVRALSKKRSERCIFSKRSLEMKALCFGSLNMDYTYRVAHFVSKGETLATDALNVFCGGKGLNQSIALARAGAAVYHAGAIGPDGQFLIRQLREAGVHTQDIQVLEQARTGHAVIQNDAQVDNCILLLAAHRMICKEHVIQVLEHLQAAIFGVQIEIVKRPI